MAVDPGCRLDDGDVAWLGISFILVLMMHPGLALFQAGLLRAKNTLSIVAQIFSGLTILSTLWFVCGYSLSFGPTIGGAIGSLHHAFLNDVGSYSCNRNEPTVPAVLYAMFQMMFASISPLLMTGAFAERMRFRAFLVLTVAWEILVYYPLAHWIFNSDGWLAKMGVLDFAGGIVIHTSAGASSVVVALVLGRRIDFIKSGGEYPPSNMVMTATGTAMLLVGWFGFNAGSAISAGPIAALAVANTQVAASSCCVVFLGLSSLHGKPATVSVMNGIIAGLAGITPACGYINSGAALLLGVVLGLSSELSVHILRELLKIDDALDVSSVHGVTGMVGSLAIGLLSSGVNPGTEQGLFYGGGWHLLGVQALAVAVAAAWAAFWTWAILRATALAGVSLRVDEEEEQIGLDATEHGETAYHNLELDRETLREVMPSTPHWRFHAGRALLPHGSTGSLLAGEHGAGSASYPADRDTRRRLNNQRPLKTPAPDGPESR